MAEFLALKDGLELCMAMGISELEVESDSLLVVQAVSKKHSDGWKFIYVLRECLLLWKDTYNIQHTYRQANGVADRCADWAHVHKTKRECYAVTEFPISIRNAIKIDQQGIWTYRK